MCSTEPKEVNQGGGRHVHAIQYRKEMKEASRMRVKGSPSIRALLQARAQLVKIGAENWRTLGGMSPGEKRTNTLNDKFDHVENHTERHFVELLEVVGKTQSNVPKEMRK